jgi:hypothetical protein
VARGTETSGRANDRGAAHDGEIERIVEGHRLQPVIFYGSHARGEPTPESDLIASIGGRPRASSSPIPSAAPRDAVRALLQCLHGAAK